MQVSDRSASFRIVTKCKMNSRSVLFFCLVFLSWWSAYHMTGWLLTEIWSSYHRNKFSCRLTVSFGFSLSSLWQRSSGSFIRREIKSSSTATACWEYFIFERGNKSFSKQIHPLRQSKSFHFLLSLASMWSCRQLAIKQLLLEKNGDKQIMCSCWAKELQCFCYNMQDRQNLHLLERST